MYDYSENQDTRKLFILNYQKQDDKIIIHFADGKERVIPNTKVNEEKILMKMRGQLRNIDKLKDKIGKELTDKKRNNTLYIILLIVFFIFTLQYALSNNFTFLITGLVCIADCFRINSENYDIKELKKKIKELDKLKFLKENEETLNTYVKMNENILQNTSEETKDMVNSCNEEKVFNINSIDKLSLEDLKTIRDNIALEKEFDFEYPDDLEEKGAYTKKR